MKMNGPAHGVILLAVRAMIKGSGHRMVDDTAFFTRRD
jgi:hypothetical protein